MCPDPVGAVVLDCELVGWGLQMLSLYHQFDIPWPEPQALQMRFMINTYRHWFKLAESMALIGLGHAITEEKLFFLSILLYSIFVSFRWSDCMWSVIGHRGRLAHFLSMWQLNYCNWCWDVHRCLHDLGVQVRLFIFGCIYYICPIYKYIKVNNHTLVVFMSICFVVCLFTRFV